MAPANVCVAHRCVPNGTLEHSVEHHALAAGVTPVEAEHELVEVRVQMRVVDGTLVGAERPPLGQRGDPMHSGQQLRRLIVATKTGRALTACLMGVAASVQPKAALPAVRDDRGACRPCRWRTASRR
jgi:hypothetical protein